MRDSVSEGGLDLDLNRATPALPAIWAGFLTLLIAGPWLGAGYIFGSDWPGPRRFDFPSQLSDTVPLEAALAAVSRIASSEWTGKLLVLSILFLAALMAYRAGPVEGFAPRAAASTLYVFNPFVFGRLHYGQYFLLAGYALLPWVAIRLREVAREPAIKPGLLLGLSVAVVGLASSHMLLVAVVLIAALVLAYVLAADKRVEYARQVGLSLALAAGTTVVLSSYWLVPFVLGRGPLVSVVAGVTPGDLTAYAAVPDGQLGLLPNLLGLYGFWAEDAGRFTSMKSFVPLWPVMLAALLVVAAIGTVWAFRQRRDHLGAWVAALLVAGAVALILEAGVSSPVTRGFVTWLDATFPVYRGMRDAGKWAALLALVYSQLVALGTAAILGWIRNRFRAQVRAEWLGSVAVGLLLALPLFYGNGLLFGMHGEIKPSSYPPGWYAADRVLAADGHPGRTLFLPWHEYMALSFVGNENSVVASPAPSFFSTPVVVSADPEVSGIAPPADPLQIAISDLVNLADQGRWAQVLAAHNIKYILLAREVDWSSYGFLDSQPGLVREGDYGSIVLYRNTAVP